MKTIRFPILFAALCFGSSCTRSGRSTPEVPVAPPGPTDLNKADAILFAYDTAGLVGNAERLCTHLSSKEQKARGLEMATQAFANISGSSSAPSGKTPDPLAGPALGRVTALVLSRCAILNADWEPDQGKLLHLTKTGADAAVAAGAKEGDPQAAYYLALNLGLSIQKRGMDAVALVKDVVAALKAAGKAPETDTGGPLRVLGYLYLKAPAWPLGPGDLDASLALLKEASERFPSHPLNHLFYAEALLEDGEQKKAAKELDIAFELACPVLWGDYAIRWQSEIQALSARVQE